MKPSFAARRKPKTIARDQDEDEEAQAQSDSVATVSAVKRPNARSRQTSSKQISFSAGASRTTSQNASDDENEAFVIKKSTLSQQVTARNAQRRAGIKVPGDGRIASVQRDDDRPRYSSDALAHLRDSTPSTPMTGNGTELEESFSGDLDIAAKFGADYLSKAGTSGIPTDAEIIEKKARRARIANELKHKATNGSESDEDQPMIDPGHDSDEDEFRMQVDRVTLNDPRKSKYPETRFVRDDEDIMEGFDEFTSTSSGRIEIGRRAEKEAKKKARVDMQNMIEEAEGGESDDSDDSERERRDMYEAVQTQKAIGTSQLSGLQNGSVPPKLPPIPTLGGILDKIRAALEEVELIRQAKQRDIEEIEQERRKIAEREDDVQRALKETAEQYQRLSIEAGIAIPERSNGLGVEDALALSADNKGSDQRGLESLTKQ